MRQTNLTNMIKNIIHYLPSSIKDRFRNTFVELYYLKYLKGTKEVEFKIPCGEFSFEVGEGGPYTSPTTWPAQADYPEPVIINEFCDILGSEDVFYNIGAGFGYYYGVATVAGVPENSIYCFEPDSYRRGILMKNISSDSHHIGEFIGEKEDRKEGIISIDSFADNNSPPTVIKMDIQGHELSAIQGMVNTLREYRPRLYVEVHPELIFGGTIENILDILSSEGYKIETVNHRSPDANWSEPTQSDFVEKSENGVDYFLRAVPQ